MKRRFVSQSTEDTGRIAAALARAVQAPCLVLLNGEMGSGKTAFVSAFARAFGSLDPVSSPTFAMVNVYESPRGPIQHFDLYRLGSWEELEGIGFEDYLGGEAVTLIEWPEIAELEAEADVVIDIEKTGAHARAITVEAAPALMDALNQKT